MIRLPISLSVPPHGHDRHRLFRRIQFPRQLCNLKLPVYQLGLEPNLLHADPVLTDSRWHALCSEPCRCGSHGDVQRSERRHSRAGEFTGREDRDERCDDDLP